MARAPRPLAAPLLALALLLVAGCGVEGGDRASRGGGSATTTTRSGPAGAPEPSGPTPDEPDTSIPDVALDQLTEVYTNMGFDEDEAACLAEQIAGSGSYAPESLSDPTVMMDLINECDISMSRLTDVTEGLAGDSGDPEDAFKNSLALGFQGAGLTEEQADCVAQGFVDEHGMDPSQAADPMALLSLFTQCDVDPNQLGG